MRTFACAIVCGLFAALSAAAQQPAAAGAAPPAPAMVLTVQGFADGAEIPVRFSQAAPGAAPGEGTSPAMSGTNVPAGTQSFVLNMRDLDVARNKTTDDQAHWVVWNIPASATSLPEAVPRGSKLAIGTEGHFVRNAKDEARRRGVEIVHLAEVPGSAMAGCGCATMSRNDPPHLVALLDLLAKGKAPDLNRVLPGDVVDEVTGDRERLDESGQARVAREARRALERMIEITEARK